MLDMICLEAPCNATLRIAQLGVGALLAVLFLQSGFDKVFNWKGELGWITEHFSKTPFKGQVPLLLAVITLFEVSTGAICALGTATLLISGQNTLLGLGFTLAIITLVQLFAGQRIAKDYPGAAAVVPYFLAAVAGLALLSY